MSLYFKGKKYVLPRGLTKEQAQQLTKRDKAAMKTFDHMTKLEQKYGKKIKLTKQISCKYCHEYTKPILNWFDGLIKCGKCDYGLWPLQSDEDCEIYLNCPQFQHEPQYLSLVSIRRRLDSKPDKKLQGDYEFFTSGNTPQQKANFEKVARF